MDDGHILSFLWFVPPLQPSRISQQISSDPARAPPGYSRRLCFLALPRLPHGPGAGGGPGAPRRGVPPDGVPQRPPDPSGATRRPRVDGLPRPGTTTRPWPPPGMERGKGSGAMYQYTSALLQKGILVRRHQTEGSLCASVRGHNDGFRMGGPGPATAMPPVPPQHLFCNILPLRWANSETCDSDHSQCPVRTERQANKRGAQRAFGPNNSGNLGLWLLTSQRLSAPITPFVATTHSVSLGPWGHPMQIIAPQFMASVFFYVSPVVWIHAKYSETSGCVCVASDVEIYFKFLQICGTIRDHPEPAVWVLSGFRY